MKKHSVFIKIPKTWIPAFAGMTMLLRYARKCRQTRIAGYLRKD
jgi:hypothetical protein